MACVRSIDEQYIKMMKTSETIIFNLDKYDRFISRPDGKMSGRCHTMPGMACGPLWWIDAMFLFRIE